MNLATCTLLSQRAKSLDGNCKSLSGQRCVMLFTLSTVGTHQHGSLLFVAQKRSGDQARLHVMQ